MENDILCKQGEKADEFYIIVSGQCTVTCKGGDDEEEIRKVGILKELDFFGESALLGEEGMNIRNATVTATTEYVQVLSLSRTHFDILVESNVLNVDVVSTVAKENERRKEVTRSSFVVHGGQHQQPPPPPLRSEGDDGCEL